MKRLLISTLGLFTLFGCTSAVDVTTAPQSSEMQEVSDVQFVHWNEVEAPGSFRFDINSGSQRLAGNAIHSAVAGFSFAYNGSPIKITLTSPIKNLSVFVPNLALYDQDFNLIRVYPAKSFDYDRNDFITGEAMQGEVAVSLDNHVTRVYALVYTTDKDLSETTTIIHPAKAFAIAKRTDPPAIDDPVAGHAATGTVEVELEEMGATLIERKPYYGDKSPEPAAEKALQATALKAQPESQTFYISAIETAVAAGDIPKALSLLDEAKALNIEGAQEAFVKAVNSK